jgi:hypothetical protein
MGSSAPLCLNYQTVHWLLLRLALLALRGSNPLAPTISPPFINSYLCPFCPSPVALVSVKVWVLPPKSRFTGSKLISRSLAKGLS